MAAIEHGIGELVGRAAVLEVEYARYHGAAELAWVRASSTTSSAANSIGI